ncbi:MAG TPA: AMP-binding protein, partial [Ktedonobacterales bacterium]|nr:AMP-binding protein [Ktedonobacterales bacterium]
MSDASNQSPEMADSLPGTPYNFSEFYRPPLVYPDVPFHEMLARTTLRVPERPAIYWRDVTLTYRELYALVRSTAAGLQALGLRKGDRLCLLMANRPEYLIAWMAASILGVVVSPMNPSYKEREVAYQLENSEATAIVVQRELLPLVQAVRSQTPQLRYVLVTGSEPIADDTTVIAFGLLMRLHPPTQAPLVEIHSDDLLALPYSSGTTGLPKGVMLTHRNLVINYHQFISASRLTEQDVFLVFLPLYHIYGVALLGQATFSGAALVLMERFDAAEALSLVNKHGVTIFPLVPPVLLGLAGIPNLSHELFPSVRHMLCAAAPMAVGPAQRVAEATSIPVLQAYGMTEASPLTHHSPIEPELIKLASPGTPVSDTAQKVVDLESGEHELPVGEVGEICVRGPQVMRGYWQAEAESARVLRDGWYHTGDVGYVDAQGYVYIVDRAKEMIKYKGFGIAPAELESVLLEHPAVRDCAVIGWPDPEAGEVPRAYVALRDGESASEDQLMQFANAKIANYKAVRQLVFVDSIPKTPSGKILRRQFKEQAQA